VLGPLARTACDATFLLAAMAGADARDPLSISGDPAQFLAPLARDFKGVRVAWSPTLGGLPVKPGVARTLAAGMVLLGQLGCEMEEVEPYSSAMPILLSMCCARSTLPSTMVTCCPNIARR
jgi:amidase